VVRFAALGSSSLPAIKLFLQGEQWYRRGQFDSSLAYARRAVALDSNFTLALRRIPNSQWWMGAAEGTPTWLADLRRAGAANHGLAPRESLLLTIDSLWGAVGDMPLYAGAEHPLLPRLAATAQELVRRYPDDPEAWQMKGEVAFHYPGALPNRDGGRASFDAFSRAVELDSAFAPAYGHIVSLAGDLGAWREAREYAGRLVRLMPHAPFAGVYRADFDLLTDPGMLSPQTRTFLETATAAELWGTWHLIRLAEDSAEAAIIAARAFTAATRGVDSLWAQRQRQELALTLSYRGHMKEALHEFLANRPWDSWLNVVAWDLTLTRTLPEDVETEWLAKLLRDSTKWAFTGLPAWARRGDTMALQRFEQFAKWRSVVTARGTRGWNDNSRFWRYWYASAPAYSALARRDTTTALRVLVAIPDTLCPDCFLERLVVAQLLSARHQDRTAAQVLEQPVNPALEGETVGAILWALERGRVNERLGNRDRALEAYRFVAAVWRHADPELQPIVEEARGGLRRLGGERN
jgi:tetratricopeptide (TPR) repeat protein